MMSARSSREPAITVGGGSVRVRFVTSWVVLLAGLVLIATGGWWVWTGLDIVQVERGWSAVIAGATMLSAGVITSGLAVILFRLDAVLRSQRPARAQDDVPDVYPPAIPLAAEAPVADPASEVVESHVAGETTYMMFADGSIEARGPQGTRRFTSLDDLRAFSEHDAEKA